MSVRRCRWVLPAPATLVVLIAASTLALCRAGALPAEAEERAKAIEGRLLAPCCYSESLAVHNSQTATDLRQEILSLVEAGRTEHDIIEGLKRRYGARILREPEGTAGWVLQMAPICVLLGGSFAVVSTIVRWRRRAAA